EVVNGGRGQRPIYEAVFLARLGGHGHLGAILDSDPRGVCRDVRNRPGNERGAERGQAVLELARGLIGADRRVGDGDHAAGVDPGRDSDHRDAGLGLAVLDGPRHGSSAAVGGQDRTVEIDPAQGRNRQQVGRENLAIGRCHNKVGAELTDLLQALLGVDILGLKDRDPTRQGRLLDLAGDQLLLSSLGPIRLGQEGHDLMSRVAEMIEHREGEVARAKYDDPDCWGCGHASCSLSRIAPLGTSTRSFVRWPDQAWATWAAATGRSEGRVMILSSCLTIPGSWGYSPLAWAWRNWFSRSCSLAFSAWRARGPR